MIPKPIVRSFKKRAKRPKLSEEPEQNELPDELTDSILSVNNEIREKISKWVKTTLKKPIKENDNYTIAFKRDMLDSKKNSCFHQVQLWPRDNFTKKNMGRLGHGYYQIGQSTLKTVLKVQKVMVNRKA